MLLLYALCAALSGGGLVVRGRVLEVLHYKSKDERDAAPPTQAPRHPPTGRTSKVKPRLLLLDISC